MNRRTINLALVGLAVAVLVWVGSGLLIGGSEPTDVVVAPTPSAVPTSIATLDDPATEPEMRGYALALPEVDGLTSDIAPGTRLEVWVTWGPEVTDRPDIRKLVNAVIYDRTIPPVVEGGPPTAMVLVPVGKVDELMYGDRFGALSVAIVQD